MSANKKVRKKKKKITARGEKVQISVLLKATQKKQTQRKASSETSLSLFIMRLMRRKKMLTARGEKKRLSR